MSTSCETRRLGIAGGMDLLLLKVSQQTRKMVVRN